jgi:hypothetical protein
MLIQWHLHSYAVIEKLTVTSTEVSLFIKYTLSYTYLLSPGFLSSPTYYHAIRRGLDW